MKNEMFEPLAKVGCTKVVNLPNKGNSQPETSILPYVGTDKRNVDEKTPSKIYCEGILQPIHFNLTEHLVDVGHLCHLA